VWHWEGENLLTQNQPASWCQTSDDVYAAQHLVSTCTGNWVPTCSIK
jgi:hypothetical protein